MLKLTYLRFKDIPENEISGVYDGDLGKIRDEAGVSCYNFVRIKNIYRIIIPSIVDGCLYDLAHFAYEAKNGRIPIYLIEGNEVGVGTYGEPLIKNVRILEKLDVQELANPKPKFKMDRHNLQIVKFGL